VTVALRTVVAADRSWVEGFVRERWGADVVVTRGVARRPADLPGVIAFDETGPAGLITYRIEDDVCEIVTIDAVRRRAGIGSLLVDEVTARAAATGCTSARVVTTNDNRTALAFYRAYGFAVVAVREGAVDAARLLKPSIPLLGEGGVPIHDEIELALAVPR
jgi:GNAT superfamily N-acetyltransferase